MIFSSFDFLFRFLPLFLILYFICPEKWRNQCLFAGSLIFYFYGSQTLPLYFVLFLLFRKLFHRTAYWKKTGCKRTQPRLNAGIFYNLFWLILFKYSIYNGKLKPAPIIYKQVCSFPSSACPSLGISFYTFQGIAYLADVYRKEIRSEHSLLRFCTWFSMFTQVTSGPITRYQEIRSQLIRRRFSMDRLETGLREFTIGLSLKVLLANQLGRLWSQVGAIGYESISTPLAWMGIIAFSLQLYFDFYGYSLMAQGIGWILGFQIPRNFAYPYQSLTMTEFWRRWHITLGKWFRDYVYIPLGGNRKALSLWCAIY